MTNGATPTTWEQSDEAPQYISVTEVQRSIAAESRIPDVTAAYDDYCTYIVNASKSKFQQQLSLCGASRPLTKPATKGDRLALDELIKSLQKLRRGRRLGRLDPISLSNPVNLLPAAERVTAQLVRLRKQFWLEKNNRRRVPPAVTSRLIDEATRQISFQWSLSATTRIDLDEVRRLLNKK